MQLTDRINRIQISPTAAVISAAEQLKSKGVDIADFGPGEPDFPTPDHIKKAAIRAIEENRSKYTPTGGIVALREAIAAWHKRELGSDYSAKECVVTVGGKHSIFNSISVLIQNGDEVILPAPYWVSYPDIIKYAGGTPVIIETHPETGFVPTAAEIEKAITPKTKMMIIDSPSNPTGGVVDPEEFERILAVCNKHGIWLMGDECYSHFVYESHKSFSIASAKNSKQNVIIVGICLKNFCDDRLAHRLYACAGSADPGNDQGAEPVHVESHVDRAIRGAGSHARKHGQCTADACGIYQAPQADCRRVARNSGRYLRMARRGILCVPEYFGAPGRWQERSREELHRPCQVAA